MERIKQLLSCAVVLSSFDTAAPHIKGLAS